MKNFKRIFNGILILAIIIIIVQLVLYIFIGYNILSDPEGSGEFIGKFLDGVNK